VNNLVFNLEEELKNKRIQSQLNHTIISQMMLDGNNIVYPTNNSFSLQCQENVLRMDNNHNIYNINTNSYNNYASNLCTMAYDQNLVNPSVSSFAHEDERFSNNNHNNLLANLNSNRSN